MKKMFCMMLMLASLVGISSCSDDDKEENLNLPSTKSMKVGDVYDMQYQSNWVSNNAFVASVNNNGVVTANRVGTANIYSNAHSCQVTVSANVTLYQEPITEWGVTQSYLTNKRGKPYSSTSDAVAYDLNSDITPYEMYTFENGKLSGAVIIVSTLYTETMLEHLSDRYKPAYANSQELTAIFINAETLEQASTAVMTNYYNSSYWMVVYMPYDKSSRSSIAQTKFLEFVKSELDKIQF